MENTMQDIQSKIDAFVATCEDIPQSVKEALASYINIQNVVANISPRGKGGKVKTNKPKDKMFAYIWRMARFNVGDDVTLPVVAGWDLSSHMRTILPPCEYDWQTKTYTVGSEELRTANGKCERVVAELLDNVSMAALITMGCNHRTGTLRWRRALHGE